MKSMRYFKWNLPVVAACVLLTACGDFFDVKPENGASPDRFYTNNSELNSVGEGMYASLAPEAHKLFLWGSARADLVVEGDTKDTYVGEFLNNTVSVINPYTDYGFLYKAIARCNHQLKNLPRMKPNGDKVTVTAMKPFYGEAYFLRAWCYFQLVRTFGEVPLILEEIADEVTYVDDAGKEVKLSTITLTDEELRAIALKPASTKKIWTAILDDLKKAMELLTGTSYNMGFNLDTDWELIRANRVAAYALATEAALWCGLYDEAATLGEYVVLKEKLGASSTWGTQYTTTDAASAILYNSFGFKYVFESGFRTNRMQEFTSPVESDGGRYLVKPKMTVCDQLFDDSQDVRLKTTYKRVDRKEVIWKYIGLDEEGKSMREPYKSIANWYLLKHADAHLLKAIAENERGNAGGAFDILNDVRVARGMQRYNKGEISMDKQTLRDLLFKEKAREDAFEGKRWYDLLLRETVLGETGIIARTVSAKYDDESQRNEVYNRLLNESSWYLPIEPERWK
ncbi:MAG: RagB/SusD family nutrient uptake outer membrane protein [Odoribacter sp.]|nr:RagB/SusD family nutrient uptake outer membrane protein [Odoribacter sp.]